MQIFNFPNSPDFFVPQAYILPYIFLPPKKMILLSSDTWRCIWQP